MDTIPDINAFSLWLTQYGSIVLFALLLVGILILPIPEETLMVLSGILMHKGQLSIHWTIIAAFAGSMCGITLTYIIGRTAGLYLVTKFGKYVGLTEKRFDNAHDWFKRFGKWALFFGYFIPGVRHFTGICAGTSLFSYRKFAAYAYCGAAVWVTLFLSIGFFFGKQWLALYDKIDLGSELIYVGVLVAVIAIIAFLNKKFRKKKISKKPKTSKVSTSKKK